MNVLITSAGRRVKIINYFRESLERLDGNVIAADIDFNAPAIHFANKNYIVPRVNEPNYVNEILNICEKENIGAIISLIDPELEILADNKELFEKNGVKLILSPIEMIKMSFDKIKTHKYLEARGLPSVPTYENLEDVTNLIEKEKMKFPLIAKPRSGSASLGIFTIENEQQLKALATYEEQLLIQPFYKNKEFGVDVYLDLESGNLIDLFIKEKLNMRAGETDKSVSVHNKAIEKLIIDFISVSSFKGPIDIDIFEFKGNYYISEVNPRFGGGYPHAHESGIDFSNYIINNLMGKPNPLYKSYGYTSGQVMMKYDNIILTDKDSKGQEEGMV